MFFIEMFEVLAPTTQERLPSLGQLLDPGCEEFFGLVLYPLINWARQLLNCLESTAAERFFETAKEPIIRGCKVGGVGWMRQDLEPHLLNFGLNMTSTWPPPQHDPQAIGTMLSTVMLPHSTPWVYNWVLIKKLNALVRNMFSLRLFLFLEEYIWLLGISHLT